MKKETKAAPGDGADALARVFEEFKTANDDRLAALERRRGDVLLEEKVDRIDRALSEQKSLIERAALNGRRPALASDPAPTSEHKSAWSAYVRRGDESGLASFEAKALAVGTNSGADGGYVAPPGLDRLIETRLRQVSPMREIATVRTTGANVGAGRAAARRRGRILPARHLEWRVDRPLGNAFHRCVYIFLSRSNRRFRLFAEFVAHPGRSIGVKWRSGLEHRINHAVIVPVWVRSSGARPGAL